MAEDKGKLNFKFTVDDKDLEKKIEKAKAGLTGMGEETVKTSKKFNSSTGNMVSGLKVLGSTFKTVMASFGLFAGIGLLTSIFTNAFRSVVQFDKSMVNMGAIAGKTRSELKELEKDIRQVAKESLNTATQVADMATELIKLGTSTQGVSFLLKPVNDLSIASGMAADATAILLKGTLNAFQETESQAQRYADVMAQALNSTALDAQKLADSFTYIASTANVAGYTVEETSAMIGVLVDSNVQASSAGRVLSSVFGRLAKGGKQLEGELEKIRNSQDKLAQASKIFGAEGARLGVILANNKNRLAELTAEFENSGGALAELTNKQLESMSAKLNILNSGWQEFVLSMENGQGRLAVVFRGLIDFLTTAVNGMTLLTKSTEDIAKDRQGFFGKGEVEQIDRMTDAYIKRRKERSQVEKTEYTQEMQDLERKEKKEELISWKQQQNSNRLLVIRQRLAEMEKTPDSRNYNESVSLQKEMERLVAGYNALGQERKKMNEIVIGEDDVETLENTIELTKERLALLDKISKLETEMNDEVMSGRELALEKVRRKYQDIIKEAEKLGMTSKKISELEAKELTIVNYKQDTIALKESLEGQAKLYTEFEQSRKEVGEAQAKEMYSNLIDTAKSYYDVISDELDKINPNDMTAIEKDRYSELSKMLIAYGDEQNKAERDRLKDLFTMTMTTEQRINEVRAKYAKLNADLISEYTGIELENRQKELSNLAQEEFDSLSDTIVTNSKKYADVAELVAGATRSQIESQIKSLTNFINTTKNITNEQKTAIQQMIDSLSRSLSSAEGKSGKGELNAVMVEYNNIENTISELQKTIIDLNKEFGDGAVETADKIAIINAQIDGLKSRLEDISFEMLIAGGKDIEKLGNEFKDLSESVLFSNSSIGSFLSGIAGVLSTSGKVVSSLGSIGKAFSDIKAQGGLAGVFSSGRESGGILGGLSSVAGALGPIASGASAIFGIVDGIGKKQREEYRLFKQWQNEVIRGEREYQALLRERSFQSVSTNQPDKDILTQQIEIARKNQKDASDSYLEQLDRLQKEGAQIIDRYRKKGLFGSKTKTKWGDLVGVDFDELERLDSMKKLEGRTKEWFDEVKKVKEELEATGLTLEDLVEQMKELMTGTNWRELSNVFADMFSNGTNSAIEFANTLEKVVKGAIVAGFKANFIDKEMQVLFEKLAQYSEDGELNQSEIDEFNRDAMARLEKLNKIWEGITKGLDIDFGEGLPSISGTDQIKRITESQASQIDSGIRGMQLATNLMRDKVIEMTQAVVIQNEYSKQSLTQLVAIKQNTDKLGDIDTNIRTLVNGNSNNYINNSNGI